MSQYRIHFVNSQCQTWVRLESLDCVDDVQATERARQIVGSEDLELWQGNRLVELFPHRDHSAGRAPEIEPPITRAVQNAYGIFTFCRLAMAQSELFATLAGQAQNLIEGQIRQLSQWDFSYRGPKSYWGRDQQMKGLSHPTPDRVHEA